ncbi:MAG: CinA family protein [Rhizomicrobium sp.]
MFEPALLETARALLDRARAKKIRFATAESCTGGLIAALLTEIPGSSDVMDRGFVIYSDVAKEELLGVPVSLLRQHGAVSAEVARAMSEGARARSRAEVAVAVTGIAGPGGGSPEKPVGLVYIAISSVGRPSAHEYRFGDLGRGEVRLRSVAEAIRLLGAAL